LWVLVVVLVVTGGELPLKKRKILLFAVGLRHLKAGGGNPRHGLVGLRRGNAQHRSKNAAKHLPSAGPPEAQAEFFCCRRRRFKHASVLERRPKSYGH
jgi:hypothetical protein